MGTWSKLRIGYYLLKGILWPHDINNALMVGKIIREAGGLDKSVSLIKASAEGRSFFAARTDSHADDLEYLASLPAGSLGKSYFQFLRVNNLDPRDLTPCDDGTDVAFLEDTVRRNHDVLHTVTGFDTSVAGELGLQAYMAKQFEWPFAMVAIGGGCLVTLFRDPASIGQVIDCIGRGWQMATQAKPLIAEDWTKHWDRPLEEVRVALGIPHSRPVD